MKKLYKLLTACTFALMLLCSTSITSQAEETKAEAFGTLTHVNPEYRNMISLTDVQEPAAYTVTDSSEPALETLSYDKAVAYVRKQMIARKTSFSFTFQWDKYMGQSAYNEFLDDVFEETDKTDPKAGDYLHFHYLSSRASYRYYYSSGSYTYEMTMTTEYFTTAKQETAFEKKLTSVMKSLKLSKKTDYEKVSAVYKYITDHITYDYDALNYYSYTGSIDSYEAAWSAYGGLVKGTCVCQGYASLFHRMMKEAGVSSRVITGYGNGGKHAWNIVKLNGKYYNLDATWDAYDPDSGIMKGTRNWFLLCPSSFNKTHVRDSQYNTSAFNKKYPMGKTNYNPDKDSANKKYTITYKLNGGKNSSKNPSTYTKSSATITLKNPTRTGYTFKGWYSDKNFKNKVTKISKGSTGNKTLYAKWAANKYTVVFNGNNNTNNVKMSSKTYKYGTSYKLPANTFKRTGYTFTGWNTKKDGSGKSYSNKASVKNLTTKSGGKVTLYAQWKKKK
ncbi:MAG: InlB B-repeat-containing protein [Roseburia sp.]|nr:InlB B-repeat-containing protein [Roseburia sp.]